MPLQTIKYTWKPINKFTDSEGHFKNCNTFFLSNPLSEKYRVKLMKVVFIKTLLRCFLNSETPGHNFFGYCFCETYHIGFWIVMFYSLPDLAKLLWLIFSFGEFHTHIQYATLLKHTLWWNTSDEVGQILWNQYIDLLTDFFIRFTKNNFVSKQLSDISDHTLSKSNILCCFFNFSAWRYQCQKFRLSGF